MDSNGHIELLQALHGRIDAIDFAPDQAPENFTRWPAVIVRSNGMSAEVITAGEGCLAVEYAYQAYLMTSPAGEGAFGTDSALAYEIADLMLTEYHRASVDGLPGVTGQFPRLVLDEAGSLTHGGLIRFAFNENNVFTAIRFDLVIEDQKDWPGSL